MKHDNTTPEATAGPTGLTDENTAAGLDLTPLGLHDAPAHQEDAESLVYTGNS